MTPVTVAVSVCVCVVNNERSPFPLQHSGIEIWARPITPTFQNYYSYGLAFVNRRVDGTPSDIAVTLQELGLYNPGGYAVEVGSKCPIL